ncbi:hypothetical protein SAMN05444344_1912 [Tenacibaculum mesophilum]|uniref:Uncharacterized protein n=2 Tax=Tenacibaculum TaxID=104267 RepID=A0AAE9SGF1_9FLAO|nr:hypothetical protein [Tenacibaculum mesophilum]GFD82753.1 hypothetical protein KUL118_56150 [Tenacibaculum sp. KUL118]GFD92667.1 hypothetical protein KUL154_14000 [Alteromonas sp. KUL154]GFD99863.1 hypothetical protein KUL156_24560 [Alteromonas sp. KUL156]AZJ32060.1 hypothetical protein D6200_05530 [Tenacibaculum mesophilum]KAF9658167.1 hypothetical protein HBA12_13235 [Tenacibaculum mesophilum]
MDLDKYKKAWGNQSEETNKVSKIDIYRMAHSKSSSIVKWIFIIGILEFIFLNSFYFIFDMEEAYEEYKKLGLYNFMIYSQFIIYPVLLYFLIKFYLNYKSISVVDSTKTLMTKIIKTRKTVKYYVIFNLLYVFTFGIIVAIASLKAHPEFNSKQVLISIIVTVIMLIVMLIVLWCFYQLLYGILLRKLNKNYKELAKLEDLN